MDCKYVRIELTNGCIMERHTDGAIEFTDRRRRRVSPMPHVPAWVDTLGCIVFNDMEGNRHNIDDQPAYSFMGDKEWYCHGEMSRDPKNGPAAEYIDRIYFFEGKDCDEPPLEGLQPVQLEIFGTGMTMWRATDGSVGFCNSFGLFQSPGLNIPKWIRTDGTYDV